MSIPVSTPINFVAECSECSATTSLTMPMNAASKASSELRSRVFDKKWQPVLVGRTCVGLLCEKCAYEATSEFDNAPSEKTS